MSVENRGQGRILAGQENSALTPIYGLMMRLPVSVGAGYFLWREWQALEVAQGWLKVSTHVATMLFLALIALMSLARRTVRLIPGMYCVLGCTEP